MTDIPERKCLECGGIIPAVIKWRGGHLSAYCKECVRSRRLRRYSNYYKDNREYFAQYHRDWKLVNWERYLEMQREGNRAAYWRRKEKLGKKRVRRSQYGEPEK